MWRYSMTFFGEQVIALLDHLEIEEAVVLGTSLGANAALEAAALAPERLRGMVIEMPVLDGALLGCALAFTPLMVALTFGEPVMRVVQAARAARAAAAVGRSTSSSTPCARTPARAPRCSQGLFFGRIAPHRSERRTDRDARARDRPPRATRSTRSPTPACSPRSCPTAGCSRRARSSSCASPPSG